MSGSQPSSTLALQVISGHIGWVRCIAIEPGNEWFATGSGDRVIKVSERVIKVSERVIKVSDRVIKVKGSSRSVKGSGDRVIKVSVPGRAAQTVLPFRANVTYEGMRK